VKFTHDPDGRAAMGGSCGGSGALIMAWYHRVLTYSGAYFNRQWPSNPQSPHGAWEFHEHLIPIGLPSRFAFGPFRGHPDISSL
jgi:S-formylglutathione hydrolase FrmB